MSSQKLYSPKPIDTSDIVIPEDLLKLTDILAKNVHENWALERVKAGWKYGPSRNDEKKLHPCLIPYDELPESEKVFDINTAMETLKVILSKGYRIQEP